MFLGVDYYPEQWGLEIIDEDFKKIKELGANLIRIGEFAWDKMERFEGKFDFSFFDKVVEKAKEYDLKIMFGIPTPTMPSWLAKKYPEVMSRDALGNIMPYGARRGYCTSSGKYIEKAIIITEQIAKHYKDEKQIVSWQIDNEIGHEGSDMCWCDSCHEKFIAYLAEKYQDIDELNERWGTSFWTQTYNSFSDIPLPKPALTPHNPSLRLEWERFRSQTSENFIGTLYKTLKGILPDAHVLHDFSGGLWDKHFNPFNVAKHMEEVAYNNYPVWGGQKEPMPPAEVAFDLDLIRGLKGQNFTITEAIMGAQGHDVIGCAPLPNQAPLWSMQGLAHGSQNLIYFRFRGFTKGAEQYCFGILDSDNKKKRKFFEVQNLFADANKHSDIFQSKIKNDVAIMFSYDSASSFKIQRGSDVMSQKAQAVSLYECFFARGVGVDIICDESDFSKYKILILPSMNIMSVDFKAKLTTFVENGGVVIATMRTAWKDTDNNLIFGEVLPCGITHLVGGEIEEHESLLSGQSREIISQNGEISDITVFAEMLKTTTATSLYSYHNSPFGDYSAVTENQFGKGTFFYFGGDTKKDIKREIVEKAMEKAKIQPLQEYSTEKETVIRQVEDKKYKIQLDYKNIKYSITQI